jgi:tRNA (guanine-N7-)-methyltransferase
MRDIYSFPWINEYVHLAKTLPDRIFSCHGNYPSDEEVATLQERFAEKKLLVEIGAGSGQHLLEQARRNPTAYFIGIEVRYKRAFKLAEKAQKRGIDNLFVIRGEANLVSQVFKEASLGGIFINFPDPWDRPKWKKNRLTAPSYLDQYATLLTDGGFLQLKTDHEEFFESTAQLLDAHQAYQLTRTERDLYQTELKNHNIPTEFEQLFLSKNQPIYFLEAIRLVRSTVQN